MFTTQQLQVTLEVLIEDFESKFGKASADDVERYAEELLNQTNAHGTHRFDKEVLDIIER